MEAVRCVAAGLRLDHDGHSSRMAHDDVRLSTGAVPEDAGLLGANRRFPAWVLPPKDVRQGAVEGGFDCAGHEESEKGLLVQVRGFSGGQDAWRFGPGIEIHVEPTEPLQLGAPDRKRESLPPVIDDPTVAGGQAQLLVSCP